MPGPWLRKNFRETSVNQVLTFLTSTGVNITDPRNSVTTPRLNLAGLVPTADAGGPYFANEGGSVGLNGSGSDPDGDPVTFAWDLDNDGAFDDAFGANPTFNLTGQDGLYPIGLRVSDPGGDFNTDDSTVSVSNVAPSVSLGSNAPQDEGSAVTVNGVAQRPRLARSAFCHHRLGGWLSAAKYGWRAGKHPPNATLTFDVQHIYADNGLYNAQVCASDDDTTTCDSIGLQINNVAPTVTAASDQIIFEGDTLNIQLASFTDPGVLDTPHGQHRLGRRQQ